jgi:hypothetical protein
MAEEFLRYNRLQRVSDAVAAGQTLAVSTGVHVGGFDKTTFIVAFGVIDSTAVTSIKVQQSNDNGVADDFSDLAGTAVAVPDTGDNKLFAVEVTRPDKDWVRCAVVRGTADATIDAILCVQAGPSRVPVTHHSTLGAYEIHKGPLEGTA